MGRGKYISPIAWLGTGMDKWLLGHPVEAEQVQVLSRLIDLAISSDSYEQLCQRIIHEDVTRGLVNGAHLYSVDSNLDMELEISYGRTTSLVEQVISAWGTSLLAKCLVEKRMQYQAGEESAHLALPLAKSSVPVGALLLVMDANEKSAPLSEAVAHLLSQVGAFFVEVRPRHSPVARANGNGSAHSHEQLSTRHIQIVQLIGAGKTNGQIGRELALSESTIRQETIKIYKILGVSGRSEAVLAAKKMGLVSRY
jgi:ATP/maltotriose-dependent transcriptional regulator MalT